jgi:hypothetical protein
MSKFWFFDRKGRPTTNEKNICDKFNSLIDEGNVSTKEVERYVDQYGKPVNESELEEMFGFLTGEDSNGNKYEYADDSDEDFDDSDEDFDDNDVEYEEVDNQRKSSSDSIDFNPFEEPVIERGYTKGFQPKSQSEDDDSDSDDEDDDSDDNSNDNSNNNSTKSFSDEDLKMPKDGDSIIDEEEEEEDIPEPEWAKTGGFGDDMDDSDDDDDYDEDEEEEGGGKLGGDNLQDLSPAQKRKSAEKTAEALLNMYCQFVPMPFIKWSSFSEGKIQKMKFENKIDLSMQLENNVSVKDYIDGVNEQAEEVFKVSDETKEEIKDPLIDVLLEQDLALTPTQRLMLAVGGHLVTMGFSAFQLAQNNKQALETFEKFHIQMNQQKAPVYQEQARQKKNPRPRPQDNLSKVERESVEELMRQMANDSNDSDEDYDEDDDIIDVEHDPSVDVSEDYEEE